jgi:hypothetical protein
MENPRPVSELPSPRSHFFGLPASWHIWSHMGRKFWAGVLVGIGLGLLLGAVLVELELMTIHSKAWASATGIVFAFLGQSMAWGAVTGNLKCEDGKPQSS